MISFRWWGLLVVSITLVSGSWWYFTSFNENDHSVEKSMVVIIPSYNNESYCEKNLTSVFSQQYENYRVIYIDDCSNYDKAMLKLGLELAAHDPAARPTASEALSRMEVIYPY